MWNQEGIFKEKNLFLDGLLDREEMLCVLCALLLVGGKILMRKGISPALGDLGMGTSLLTGYGVAF